MSSQNTTALNMIANGIVNTAEIAQATGLSTSQVRYRFKQELANAKTLPVEVANDSPNLSGDEAILKLLQIMQKDMAAMRSEMAKLIKSNGDGKWYKNPYDSETWNQDNSEREPNEFMFKYAFTGGEPKKCLIEIEMGDGRTLTGLAGQFSWATTTVTPDDEDPDDYSKTPRAPSKTIVKYKIIQPGN
jgi:antitoxin component of RelBE/YafQ-DinJ toxin-antitoxin module